MLYCSDVIEEAKKLADANDLTHILIFKSSNSNDFAAVYCKDTEEKAYVVISEVDGRVRARKYSDTAKSFDTTQYNLIGLFEIKPNR